ncbi:DUF4124 domain-containing protein [Thauera sp.]|uniref:DUF4124 domain-containing protein n=1 Tax=unclassified Thauera TaxID=2609274 RepID=UPI00338F0BCF
MLFAQTAPAAGYKCVSADGKVTYQATPCPTARGSTQGILPSASQVPLQSASSSPSVGHHTQ